MIPILYAKTESTFTHNGIGFLKDATKCTVTEERNGSYECSLQYPITGQWYDQITEGCIIKAKANDTSEPQLFRIYKSSKTLKGIVTYSAEHISYDLKGIPTLGFSVKNVTPQAAITRAIQDAGLPSAFTAISDISTLNSTTILTPCSVRAILGGQEGSVLDVWGGEFEFDNFVVKLHKHRGSDRGVSIEYGKNLKDIKQEANIADCYTHLMPYARYSQDGEGDEKIEVYVYLSEKVLPLNNAENIGQSKAYIMDFTDRFGEGEAVTEEALRAKATAYAAAAELGIPKVNITVSFVQLWQTEEYKNIAPLERVMMCDTVSVRFSKLGVTASAKVIKTTYNTLEEKYDSVELGDAKSSFADTVNKQQADIEEIKTSVKKGQAEATEQLKKAIANATSLITGHSGGYVVLNPAEKPQEILILDAPTIEEAVKVWRWNSGGLGYSSTGYNGEYALAMTMDGAINADFINGGTIKGQSIVGGNISGSNIEIFNGNLTVYSGSNALSQKAIYFDEKGNLQYKGHISSFETNIKCKIGKTDLGTFIFRGLSLTKEHENYLYNNDYLPYLSFGTHAESLKSKIFAYEHLDICVYGKMPSNVVKLSCTKNGGNLFGTWYGTSSQAIPSDLNKKNSIEALPEIYSTFFDLLNPKRYKYNDGTSNRYHTGFIAQDIEQALITAKINTSDFAGFIKDDKDEYYLRYEEFVALCVNEIQKLKKQNIDLIKKVDTLEMSLNITEG